MAKLMTSANLKKAAPVLVIAAAAAVLYGGYRIDRTASALEQLNDPAGRELLVKGAAFQKRMSEVEPADILAAEALAADPDLTRTRAKLAQRRAVLEEYRAWVATTPAVEQAEMTRILDIELEALKEFDAVVDVLEAAEGRWRVHKGQMVFDSPQDEAALAARWRTLERLGAEQDAVRAQAYAKGAYSSEDLGG